MAEQKVEVVTPFQNGFHGSRTEGEIFDYDTAGDPHGLIALGYVKPAGKASAKAADAPQG